MFHGCGWFAMQGKKISPDMRREIEALSREGKTQREIAQLAHVCTDTVRTVERKSLGLRQPAKRTRGRLSAREKTRIAKLYEKEGKTITDICNRMRISRGSVTALIKRMGLVAGLPENKILALRKLGFTQREIACKLRLNYGNTFRWFRAHGFTQPRYAMTPQKIAAIDRAILNREATAISIAKNYSASYTYTLARAHVLLECERFLGISKPPLTSYFPSRPPRPMKRQAEMAPEKFVENFFPFKPRPGVLIGDAEIDLAARTLLQGHVLFFGKPVDETEYLSRLRTSVALHLARATQTEEWVN